MYSDWQAAAKSQIAKLHEQFDPSMTWQERQKVLREGAWKFHGGTSWGQKVWAKHCRRYLEMHGKPPLKPTKEPTFAADIVFPFRVQNTGEEQLACECGIGDQSDIGHYHESWCPARLNAGGCE